MGSFQATSPGGSIRTLIGVSRASDRRPLALAAVALSAVAATHLIDYGAYGLKYPMLDANSASSWSHRVDVAILAIGAAVGWVGGVRAPQRRKAWAILGAILLFFIVDEMTSLHSHIGRSSYGKILYAPILIVLVACMWRVCVGLGNVATLVAGLALLLASYAIHILGPHVLRAPGWSTDSWPYQIKVALKQGTEFAGLLVSGWALVLSALGSSAGAPQCKRIV